MSSHVVRGQMPSMTRCALRAGLHCLTALGSGACHNFNAKEQSLLSNSDSGHHGHSCQGQLEYLLPECGQGGLRLGADRHADDMHHEA